MKKISILIPAYNEVESLPKLFSTLEAYLDFTARGGGMCTKSSL